MAWRRPRIKPSLIKAMPLLEVGDIIVLEWSGGPILIHRIIRQNYDYVIWGLDVQKQIIVKKQLSPSECKKYIKTHIKGEMPGENPLPNPENKL